MNKKNYTFVSDPAKFRFVNSLYLAALTLFVAFVLTSCEFWQQPVRGYFEEWTSEVSIVKFEVDGVETYYDKDGNLCIPSGNQNVPLTLFLINPHHYNYITDYSEELPQLDTTNRVITADANDTTLLHLTYSNSYLKDHDGKSGDNGEIGTTINYRHPVNKTSKSYTFSLRCNSKPPKITDGAVMVNTNNGSSTYCLCFNLPLPTIHYDLKTIIINDGSSSSTINCHVESSGAIILDDAGNLSLSAPAGDLDRIADGPEFRASTNSPNHLYYKTAIPLVPGKEQSFTITLVDEAGLSCSTVISTTSEQIRSPVVKDAVSNATISASISKTLQLNSDYNAKVSVSTPNQLSNGQPVNDVTVKYTLTMTDPSVTQYPETTLDSTGIIELQDTGTYQLKIQAEKEGYLSSSEITYTIVVPPLKVTFNANGGTITTTTQDVPKNTSTPLKSASELGLSRTGYTLQGWASTSNGSVANTDGASVTLVSDITLYAIWQANTHTVSFNKNGGTGTANDKTVTYDQAYGTLPTLTKTGYDFKGWWTASSGGTEVSASTICKNDSDHTLYARWQAKTCTVSFNKGGGTGTANSKTVTYDKAYGTLPTLTKTGYEFKGWWTASSGGEEKSSTSVVKNENNHILYARWEAETIEVTFDANGGYFSGSTTSKTIESTYDSNYVLPSSNPKKTGYKFAGWYTNSSNGTQITSSTVVQRTTNQTLYAHWDLEYYSITKGSVSNGSIGNPSCSLISNGKYGYDQQVTVVITSNTNYGLSTVFVDSDETGNHLGSVSRTENSATKTTITFNMPAYDVTINCTFKPAYTVDITSSSTNIGSDSDGGTVKSCAAGKKVRLWIVGNSQAYTSSSYYKDITLNSNAEYHGYICLPGNNTSLSNAKVCAMTYDTIAGYGERGFGFRNVDSSNNATILLDKYYFAIFFDGETNTSSGDTHKTVAELSRNDSLGQAFPSGLGFKYQWVGDSGNGHAGLKPETNSYQDATWSSSDDGTRVMLQITAADIKTYCNNVRTIGEERP